MGGALQVSEWLTGVPVQHSPRGRALPDRAWVVWRGDSERRNRRRDIRSSQSPNTPWSPPPAEERKETQQRINKWRVCMRDSINTDIIKINHMSVQIQTHETHSLHRRPKQELHKQTDTKTLFYMTNNVLHNITVGLPQETENYMLYFQKYRWKTRKVK